MHNPDLRGEIHTLSAYVGGLYGTVSAHAATITSIALFSSMLIGKRWWSYTMVAWTVLICYSRIYLGAHYPRDIFFGVVLGLALGYIAVLVWRRCTSPQRRKS
jgi:undecaprenyl-diphosphatase